MFPLRVCLLLCLVPSVTCLLSIQEFVDSIFANHANKLALIDNDPIVTHRIYSYFHQLYRADAVSRLVAPLDPARLQIFKANLKFVLAHNDDPANTFKLKLNEFSDWTDRERDALRTKINNEPVNTEQPIESRDQLVLPDQYDWTNQTRVPDAVTPVKNQRHCGSCYAFAMVGALEKTYAQIYNRSGPLSPQQLVDCSFENGCEGGSFVGTFEYIRQNGFRLNLESDYPSTTDGKKQDTCQKTEGARLSFNDTFPLRYQQLPTENENYMKEVLFRQGPLYFSFNCGKREGNDTILREVSDKFDHYASGVFDVPGCPTHRNMNHALVIVGYGSENGTDFWRVKNSWGQTWGDHGYLKIKRNENMCGIATWPYYVGLF